jgi:hypothetical protein
MMKFVSEIVVTRQISLDKYNFGKVRRKKNIVICLLLYSEIKLPLEVASLSFPCPTKNWEESLVCLCVWFKCHVRVAYKKENSKDHLLVNEDVAFWYMLSHENLINCMLVWQWKRQKEWDQNILWQTQPKHYLSKNIFKSIINILHKKMLR